MILDIRTFTDKTNNNHTIYLISSKCFQFPFMNNFKGSFVDDKIMISTINSHEKFDFSTLDPQAAVI